MLIDIPALAFFLALLGCWFGLARRLDGLVWVIFTPLVPVREWNLQLALLFARNSSFPENLFAFFALGRILISEGHIGVLILQLAGTGALAIG